MTRPFRRTVLYLPGFDPFPPRRYREIYRREAPEQAQVSGYRIVVENDRRGWQTTGTFPEAPEVLARFEVLVWHDIVQASMTGGVVATYRALARTAALYLRSGALRRLAGLRRGPVLAALYPVAMMLAQAVIAVLLGWFLGALVGGWTGLLVGIAAFCGVLALFRRADRFLLAHYLTHDFAFAASHGGAYPPDLAARLAEFGDRLAQAIADPEADEVLLVGHSSGAYLAVSVMADVIRQGRATGNAALSLLTLGHVIPMASFLPGATRLRDDLAFLSAQPDLFWLDVTAPGDPCSFALCDPVAVSGLATSDQRWPLVLSAAYRQTLSPAMRRRLKGRWFRLHFQYLYAFDRPGAYDYFAITAGPLTLAQRFAGRGHSPGRIARSMMQAEPAA